MQNNILYRSFLHYKVAFMSVKKIPPCKFIIFSDATEKKH